jgi:hypothetical protein
MLRYNVSRLDMLGAFLVIIGTASAQFVPTGDWEADKRNWLASQTPPISVNKRAPYTVMNGVLWPTLVQVQSFVASYSGPVEPCGLSSVAPVCITGGSEGFDIHVVSGGRTHGNGFKVDLGITNKSRTYSDLLSAFVVNPALTHPFF